MGAIIGGMGGDMIVVEGDKKRRRHGGVLIHDDVVMDTDGNIDVDETSQIQNHYFLLADPGSRPTRSTSDHQLKLLRPE